MNERLHNLVLRIADLEGAHVGRGPHHPTDPDPILEPRIRLLLEHYPALGQDRDYVDFLLTYAGASVLPGQLMSFDIRGFTEQSAPLPETEEEFVEEAEYLRNGFFVFAQGCYATGPGEVAMKLYADYFAFDIKVGGGSGVFRRRTTEVDLDARYVWHKAGFLDWLEEAVGMGCYYEFAPIR